MENLDVTEVSVNPPPQSGGEVLVFVYGTLKKGFSNHERFLKGKEKISDAVLHGYNMYSLGRFPGIVVGKGNVYGEVYEVNQETLRRLDALEGYMSGANNMAYNMYVRKEDKAFLLNGHTNEYSGLFAGVFVYIYNHPDRLGSGTFIYSGVWNP